MGYWWAIEHYRALLNTIEHCWTLLNAIEHYWTLSNTIECYWTLLNTIKHYWTLVNTIEHHGNRLYGFMGLWSKKLEWVSGVEWSGVEWIPLRLDCYTRALAVPRMVETPLKINILQNISNRRASSKGFIQSMKIAFRPSPPYLLFASLPT